MEMLYLQHSGPRLVTASFGILIALMCASHHQMDHLLTRLVSRLDQVLQIQFNQGEPLQDGYLAIFQSQLLRQ
jgi:hypothetical protein